MSVKTWTGTMTLGEVEPTKWEQRDKKRHKKRYGMRIDGVSVRLLDRLKRKIRK